TRLQPRHTAGPRELSPSKTGHLGTRRPRNSATTLQVSTQIEHDTPINLTDTLQCASIYFKRRQSPAIPCVYWDRGAFRFSAPGRTRSEEHTSELQSRFDLVCRLLLEKKK